MTLPELFLALALLSLADAPAPDHNPPPAPPTNAPSWPFEFSKETTLVEGPVRRDGTVDYVAAINDRLSEGVTRDNNAAVPLLDAIARGRPKPERHYAALREKLGLPDNRPAPGQDADDFAGQPPARVDQTLERPWTASESPEAAKWLESAAPRLNLLVEASKRERYYMPLIRPREEESMAMVLLPHLNEVRQLALALGSRAMLDLGNEDGEAFRRDAVAVVRLGRLLSAGPTTVEKLVAIGCESIGLNAIKSAAAGGWLSDAQAQAILSDLRAAPAEHPIHEVFELTERGFLLEFIQFAAVHGVGEAERQLQQIARTNDVNRIPIPAVDGIGKDWNAALRKANGWFDRMADAGGKPTYAEMRRAAEAIERDLVELRAGQAGVRIALSPLEDRAIALLLPGVLRAYQSETRVRANRRLAEVALALSSFRSVTGQYPQTLKELVPAYFKEEPLDPFTAKPLVYVSQGQSYVLRSIPAPLPDAGGRGDAMPELTVRGPQ